MSIAEILQTYKKAAAGYSAIPRQLPFADYWFAGNDLIEAYTQANSINPGRVNLLGARRRWLEEAEKWAVEVVVPCRACGHEQHGQLCGSCCCGEEANA